MSSTEQGTNMARRSIWDIDLDEPINFEEAIPRSDEMGTSRRPYYKKKKSAHQKDPTYPPANYTQFAYEVCLQWYARKSARFLDVTYLKDPLVGIMKLTQDMQARILTKCKESKEFGDVDLTYNNQLFPWLENTLHACIFNTKKLMLEVRWQGVEFPTHEDAQDFTKKMEWWDGAVRKLSKTGTRGMKWKNASLMAAFAREGVSCITWVPGSARIVALTGFDQQGGYGKVRKVRIEQMETIPPHVFFAGKVPKVQNLKDARAQRSMEALACPLTHPGIIKIFAIHARTMEAYTLWWNGGTLMDLMELDKQVSPTTDWHEMKRVTSLPEEKRKELTLFRRHKAKLAWALVYVASLMHEAGVLHNDLSPRNILFHFPDYSNEIINIGICDWGIASRLDENAPSHYGSPSEEAKKKDECFRWWVAPELFYAYGPEHSETSIPRMQAQHKYSKKSDSYSIGKLTEWMKIGDMGHDWDREVFNKFEASKYFATKLQELIDPNPNHRASCVELTKRLMDAPWFLKPPESVFRQSHF